MSIETDEKLAQAWVNYYLNGDESDFFATEKLVDITFSDQVRAWNIVRIINEISIYEKNWSQFVDGVLAAGPIEDLLSMADIESISRIKKDVFQNERFQTQLKLVNKNKIDGHVLEFIQREEERGR